MYGNSTGIHMQAGSKKCLQLVQAVMGTAVST